MQVSDGPINTLSAPSDRRGTLAPVTSGMHFPVPLAVLLESHARAAGDKTKEKENQGKLALPSKNKTCQFLIVVSPAAA